MADVIDREQMRGKLLRMADRIKQRRDGAYKCGYKDACSDALMKLSECSPLKTDTITKCHECRHAMERNSTMPYCTIHNRRRAPDDYCNHGENDFE